MGKISKVLVCGYVGVGKIVVIEYFIYGIYSVGFVSIIKLYNWYWYWSVCFVLLCYEII